METLKIRPIKEGAEPLPREIVRNPELAIYIQNFGQPSDICLAAGSKGMVLGAV